MHFDAVRQIPRSHQGTHSTLAMGQNAVGCLNFHVPYCMPNWLVWVFWFHWQMHHSSPACPLRHIEHATVVYCPADTVYILK